MTTPSTSTLPQTLCLSSLELNLRSREVRRDLADPWEMHRTLLRAFDPAGNAHPGEGARQAGRLLFRVEQTDDDSAPPQLLVQHHGPADWARLPAGYLFDFPHRQPRQRTDLLDRLDVSPGTRLRFRLRANPVKCEPRPRGADGLAPRGKRVALTKPGDQAQWLNRQLAGGKAGCTAARLIETSPSVDIGFAVQIIPDGWQDFRKAAAHRGTGHFVLFEGILVVEDPSAFRELVATGVGPAKAFGCGLLSLAPAAY